MLRQLGHAQVDEPLEGQVLNWAAKEWNDLERRVLVVALTFGTSFLMRVLQEGRDLAVLATFFKALSQVHKWKLMDASTAWEAALFIDSELHKFEWDSPDPEKTAAQYLEAANALREVTSEGAHSRNINTMLSIVTAVQMLPVSFSSSSVAAILH